MDEDFYLRSIDTATLPGWGRVVDLCQRHDIDITTEKFALYHDHDVIPEYPNRVVISPPASQSHIRVFREMGREPRYIVSGQWSWSHEGTLSWTDYDGYERRHPYYHIGMIHLTQDMVSQVVFNILRTLIVTRPRTT